MIEISRLLRITRRRLALMILAALVVAVPVSVGLLLRPTEYKATASVQLGSLYDKYASDKEQARVTADFGAALQVSSVDSSAAAAGHTSAPRVHNTLEYDPPESGYIATVSYTDSSSTRARAVVGTASRDALELLASQDLQDSTAAANQAQQRAQSAAMDVSAYLRSSPASNGQAEAVANLRNTISTNSPLESEFDQALNSLELNGGRVPPTDAVYEQKLGAFKAALGQFKDAAARDMTAENNEAHISAQSNVVIAPSSAIGPVRTAAVDGFIAGAAAAILVAISFAVSEYRRGSDKGDNGGEAGEYSASGPDPSARITAKGSSLAEGGDASPRANRIDSIWRRLSRMPPRVLLTAGLALALPLAVLIGYGIPMLFGEQKKTLALAAAVPIGIGAGLLALNRFEIFLLSLLVLRTSLDAVNVSSSSGSGIDPGAAVGLVFLLAAIFWLLAQRRWGSWVKTSAPVWWLWVFVAATALSAFSAAKPLTTLEATTKVAAGAAMFQVLEQYLNLRPERVKRLFGCLLLSSILPCVVAVYQAILGHGDSVGTTVSRVEGTYVHPSSLANFLLFTLPLTIMLIGWCRGRARIGAIALTALYGILLILTYTRAAWVAAVVFILYLGIRYNRRIFWLFLVTVAVLVLAVPSVSSRFTSLGGSSNPTNAQQAANSDSMAWRISYWKEILPQGKHDLINGIGFEMVQATNPQHLDPHDGFVQAYVEMGLVGVAALIGLLASFAVYIRRRLRAARSPWERMLAMIAVGAAIAWLLQMPVENLFDQTFIYWYLAVAMTFGYPMQRASAETNGELPLISDLVDTPERVLAGV